MCGIVDYIWGDIQLERWILENAGNAATQVTISLLQVLNDVINGAEHINMDKIWMGACIVSDVGQVLLDSFAVTGAAQVTAAGVCSSETLIGVPVALLGFYATTVALNETWNKSGDVVKDCNTFNNESWVNN